MASHMLTNVFLCQFDMSRGNTLVWSARDNDPLLKGIEFKALPSGIHEVSDDVIRFCIEYEQTQYYGICCYLQNAFEVLDNEGQVDRSKVKMYSLGVIVDPSQISDDLRGFNYEVTNQYIPELQSLLKDWSTNQGSNSNSYEQLSTYYHKKISGSLNYEVDYQTSMLNHLPYWLNKLGPLIFPLFKSCLLRERILVISAPGNSFEYTNSLLYCLATISRNSKLNMGNTGSKGSYIPTLFTVGTYDIEDLEKHGQEGFLAVTSDEILLYKEELFDKALILPSDSLIHEGLELQDNKGHPVKATIHESRIFNKLLETYCDQDITKRNLERFSRNTETMSWLQYILDSMLFLATAGHITARYNETREIIQKSLSREEGEPDEHYDARGIVQFFNSRSDELLDYIQRTIEDSNNILPATITIDLDMDYFGKQDYEFLRMFAKKWLDKDIMFKTNILGIY